jgi:hypothetical protein
MAANQALQTHGAGELNVEGSGEAEHHNEEKHANKGAIGQMISANLSPVRLGLFAWRYLEANGQLRRPAHTQGGKETADNALGALKTHFSTLLGQTRSRKPVLLESLSKIILRLALQLRSGLGLP